VPPLVSALVPLYNHSRYVAAALDSIVGDGYPDLEIVVCDDGSTDASGELVQAWIASHPTVDARLIRQSNRGIGATLNRLVGEARGTYVATLASDDELIPGGISGRLRVMTGSARAVFGDAVAIDADGAVIRDSFLDTYRVNRSRLATDPASEIILNWGIPGPVLLAETEAIREVGGYREDVMVEDWDLYLRLAARGWLRFIDIPVARYRVHAGGASQRRENDARMVRDQRSVAESNLPLFTGRHRLLMRLMVLVYTPGWRLPMRVVRRVVQWVDRLRP
jgi:glycosyltransferase involved in cell wall biosynthesis